MLMRVPLSLLFSSSGVQWTVLLLPCRDMAVGAYLLQVCCHSVPAAPCLALALQC